MFLTVGFIIDLLLQHNRSLSDSQRLVLNCDRGEMQYVDIKK